MNQTINWQMSFINRLFKNSKKKFVHLIYNIWGVDLADMQSLCKYNKGNNYLLCANDLFSKYVWVFPLNNEKGTSIVNAFRKTTSKGRKSNKIWVDEGSEFYNKSLKDL